MNLAALTEDPIAPETEAPAHLTRGMAEKFRTLRPGRIIQLTDAGGNEFAIMHMADMEHLLHLAGLALGD